MIHPNQPCDCERGGKCTPVGLCSAQEMVADALYAKDDELERLELRYDALAKDWRRLHEVEKQWRNFRNVGAWILAFVLLAWFAAEVVT